MDQTHLQEIKRKYSVVGNCDQLNRALDICLQVASTDLSVLIIGESGVGKEILPRIIHDNSPRRREKYLAINCGSIPEGTIDSELFGHERGSFTGAIGESEGYFGVANGGTLFLDEVGELPLSTQARLLRVLETGEYIRVGGQEVRKTNVRIVAATNVNMRKAISEGKFREDLYYRLNTIPVQMPPLRERGTDILLLFRLFALQMMERYHLPRIELADDAKRLLMKYKWPGNVRQLKNITEQICVLAKSPVITADDLLHFIPDDRETMAMTAKNISSGSGHTYESERQMLFNFLFELQSNIASMSNDIAELRQQLAALGGQPAGNHVRALLPPAHNLPSPGRYADTQGRAGDNSIVIDAEAEEMPSTDERTQAQPHERDTENLNIHQAELEQIRKALIRNNGNRKKAAEELGISDRTLYRRLKEMGKTD